MSGELRDQLAVALHETGCGCPNWRYVDRPLGHTYKSAADAALAVVAPLLAEKDAEIAALKVELLRRGAVGVEGEQWAIPHRCVVGVATASRVARAPRVWHEGDPEPRRDVRFTDCHGDEWRWSESRGEWVTPETAGCSWEHIAKKWSPLTEVVSDGD